MAKKTVDNICECVCVWVLKFAHIFAGWQRQQTQLDKKDNKNSNCNNNKNNNKNWVQTIRVNVKTRRLTPATATAPCPLSPLSALLRVSNSYCNVGVGTSLWLQTESKFSALCRLYNFRYVCVLFLFVASSYCCCFSLYYSCCFCLCCCCCSLFFWPINCCVSSWSNSVWSNASVAASAAASLHVRLLQHCLPLPLHLPLLCCYLISKLHWTPRPKPNLTPFETSPCH